LNNIRHEYYIQDLPNFFDYRDGTNYINQVISYERLTGFAQIQNDKGDHVIINHTVIQKQHFERKLRNIDKENGSHSIAEIARVPYGKKLVHMQSKIE
jgi:hypothetical protein